MGLGVRASDVRTLPTQVKASRFELPTRLADGLGLESIPVSWTCAPERFTTARWFPRTRTHRIAAEIRLH